DPQVLHSIHQEKPERIPRPARFMFGKEGFFAQAKKRACPEPAEGRGCTEAYTGTASRVGGRAVEISAGGPTAYKPFVLTGILFLLLPLVWPEYFFPLVWLAFIFLLEPVNHKAGAPSLLREWEKGSPREFYLLLLAGAICGLLWELWNFRAGSKWMYTVPHLGFLKIFEMPLLGFLGFPPFALECYAMTAAFFLLISKIRGKYTPGRALCIYASLAASMLLFDILVF